MTLGVLVVGAGFIADEHIRALQAARRARLIGLVDTAPGRAEAAAHRHGGVRWSADLASALSWPEVDAVILCTPNHTHAPIGATVAAAGKHLLVEKPLATTVADARALAAQFEAAGRILAVAHTHRCYDYGRAVKAAIENGSVGRPTFARLAILGGWIWPDWRSWILDPERSGGHSLHNGVHLLDLVTWWLADRPVSIFARGRRQTAAELQIYDYLEMVVSYENGGAAVCEMSRAHRPGSFSHRDLLVRGGDGSISQEWDGESSLLFTESGAAAIPSAGNNGFAVQLESWLDAIDGADPVGRAADGVLAVAMGVAAERSIASGVPVQLAEVLAS